jgi:hypothetical protein
MLRNVILFAALAIPGYILVKFNILKNEHSAPLSKILMYVGLPFMIVSAMVNNLSIDREFWVRMLAVSAIGVIYTLVLLFVAKPLSAFEKNEKTYFSYFIKGNIRGKDVKIAVAPPDKGGYTVLDIVFGDAMQAELKITPFEIKGENGNVITGNTYTVFTKDENGEGIDDPYNVREHLSENDITELENALGKEYANVEEDDNSKKEKLDAIAHIFGVDISKFQ